ncbi:MAG: hypothetical protein ACJ76V_04965 [Thermoleophilaceae bacterium]
MPDLEGELRALRAAIEHPDPAGLAARVRARVEGLPAPGPRRRPSLPARRTLAIALAALVALGGAAFAASPPLRHSVLHWLGLRGVKVERVPELPKPAGAGERLGLGRRTSLPVARGAVSFRLAVPAALGPPDEVWLSRTIPRGQLSFVYARGPHVNALVTQFVAQQPFTFLEKFATPQTRIERVRVDGSPGAWIAGVPHEVAYTDADGTVRTETLRLATNTLIWQRGGVTLRLEAHVPKARALEIARSFR